MSIRVYVVGIHFRHNIEFVPDITDPKSKTHYMSGGQVLKACADKWNLRYKLSTSPPSVVAGHINYVSYTPDKSKDDDAIDPGSSPRITFRALGTPYGDVYPFFGQPLSLIETLRPLGEISEVLQYTVQSLDPKLPNPLVYIPGKKEPGHPEIPAGPDIIGPSNDARSSFGVVGIPDNSEVRIRLLSIYCTY